MIWTLVPFDLLDVVDPPVVEGAAPWSWLFLGQRIPFVLVALTIWIGAWGTGTLALRSLHINLDECERLFFSICFGLSILSLETLLFGLTGYLNRGVMFAAFLIPSLIEIQRIIRFQMGTSGGPRTWSRPWAFTRLSPAGWLIITGLALFFVVQMLGAMSPQTDFDVVEYHLGGPKEWFQQNRISRLPHNVYTNFPFLSEMLILAGMVLYGDWQWGALGGQAAIAGFAPLTALGLFAAGRRWFSTRAGWIAAMIYLSSPWTYRISIIAYAEGSLSCFLFAAIFAAFVYQEQLLTQLSPSLSKTVPMVFLTGTMAGSAMACKYTGLVSVVVPVGIFVAWMTLSKTRVGDLRHCVIVGGIYLLGVAACVGPWLAKNAVATGNPVYPLAVRIFGGVDRDEELDTKWRNGHAARKYKNWSERLADLPVKLTDVAANNDWHSPLMFGLAPLSLFWMRGRRRNSNVSTDHILQRLILGVIWLYVVWQFSTWWLFTHHIDRFYVPMFSVVALLAGVGACWPDGLIASPGFAPTRDLPQRPSDVSAFAFPAGDHSAQNWHRSTLTADPVKSLPSTIWNWTSGAIIVASILYNADIMLRLGGFNAGRLDLLAARDIATPSRIKWLNEGMESGRLPSNMKVLCVGEAELFHARFPYLYNTVFDRCLLEELCRDPNSTDSKLRTVDEIRQEFRRLGVTHIDVNWAEIGRYRAPGSYGYTDFIQPELFLELQRLGLLGPSLLTTKTENPSGIVTGQIFPVID